VGFLWVVDAGFFGRCSWGFGVLVVEVFVGFVGGDVRIDLFWGVF